MEWPAGARNRFAEPGHGPISGGRRNHRQIRDASSEGTGEDVSQAAQAGTGTAGEVEAAGHFRIYLGAAPASARPTPCSPRAIAARAGR